jgi:hypothetical protein
MSKECAMVYYFKPFFSLYSARKFITNFVQVLNCTQLSISYPIWCQVLNQAPGRQHAFKMLSPESRLESRCSLGISVSSQSGGTCFDKSQSRAKTALFINSLSSLNSSNKSSNFNSPLHNNLLGENS